MLHARDCAQARYEDFLREAEHERLINLMRAGQPRPGVRLLLALGNLLVRCGLWLMARSQAGASPAEASLHL